jgi:hypothetical protein
MFVEDVVACMLACFIQEAADDCHYHCAIHHHELACLLKRLYNYDHGEVETGDEEEEEKEEENHRSYS